ncbi:MAG: hypothetical protein N6V49_03100 [Serratia symbiotica]|nr:hypothetical protein [Serratia symbiotica]
MSMSDAGSHLNTQQGTGREGRWTKYPMRHRGARSNGSTKRP